MKPGPPVLVSDVSRDRLPRVVGAAGVLTTLHPEVPEDYKPVSAASGKTASGACHIKQTGIVCLQTQRMIFQGHNGRAQLGGFLN